METLNSIEALRMFGILAEHISAKPDRKSVPERVMECVDALHGAGFVIVPRAVADITDAR
jgi:hypothetical protein